MKILVVGSGGREHAILWALRRSSRRDLDLYCASGNAGIEKLARRVSIDASDISALAQFASAESIDLTFVGPEGPLAAGIVDEFEARGLAIAGPSMAAARLEGSKAFAKAFMDRHGIPTARFSIAASVSDGLEQLRSGRFGAADSGVVVKADGLAAGKGVVICKSKEETTTVASEMLSGKMLGEAGTRVVVEECLQGEELSFLVVSDGERVAPLVAAQDHKRVGDGDTGPNTGGMGAYSTKNIVDEQMRNWLVQHIARPVVAGMKAEGAEYKGVLYCGLMMTARGPMVLEFNSRFGDPETQPIVMRMESDLAEALEASIEGRVSDGDFRWSNDASVCVVMASGGYPGTYDVGKKITGLEEAGKVDGVKVFHAGTTKHDGGYFTAGGRVLGVTARAADLKTAVERAYDGVSRIKFEGAQHRKDIAARALKK